MVTPTFTAGPEISLKVRQNRQKTHIKLQCSIVLHKDMPHECTMGKFLKSYSNLKKKVI